MLHVTLRVRVRGAERWAELGGPVIFGFWHGEQQLVLAGRPRSRLTVMTSASSDGRLQARILRRFGIESVTGSSSRQAASGLLGLVRALRSGVHVAVALDGPRGPSYQAKGGAVQLARSCGRPIVAVRAEVSSAWVIRGTWDAFVVPLPFARVTITYLDPLEVPRSAPRSELENLRRVLDARLGRGRAPLVGTRRPRSAERWPASTR